MRIQEVYFEPLNVHSTTFEKTWFSIYDITQAGPACGSRSRSCGSSEPRNYREPETQPPGAAVCGGPIRECRGVKSFTDSKQTPPKWYKGDDKVLLLGTPKSAGYLRITTVLPNHYARGIIGSRAALVAIRSAQTPKSTSSLTPDINDIKRLETKNVSARSTCV